MEVVTRTIKAIADTGEILSEEEVTENMYAWNKDGYLFYNGKRGVRVNPRAMLAACLDDTDIGRLVRLMNEVDHFGRLRGDLSDALSLSVVRARGWAKRMMDKGVIRKVGHSIYVNPIYASRSARVPTELYNVFQPELDPLIPEWARDKYAEANVL